MIIEVTPRRAVLVLGSLAAGVAGGVALADIPDANDVFHACVRTTAGAAGSVGDIRMIDTEQSQTCADGEKHVVWNQHGRPGPTGPQGPAGAPGPAGTTRVLTAAHPLAIKLPKTASTAVGTVDLPEGSWIVTVRGDINILPAVQKLRKVSSKARASLNFTSERAFNFSRVECSMAAGQAKVSSVIGDENLLPAVQKASATTSAFNGYRPAQHKLLNLSLVAQVPAGGLKGTLACGNKGTSSAASQATLSNLQINATQAADIHFFNFTLGDFDHEG